MAHSILREMVRQFPENGMKLLLSNPHNVRDLLTLAGCEVIDLIDFERLKPLPTTLVKRDYRHVECDVVLSAPLREKRSGRGRRSLLLYILIEHQSNPDWLMPLRLLDYLVQVYWSQLRGRRQQNRTLARRELHPVLPVVFYTGEQRWEACGSMVDLLGLGELFARVTPKFEPLFVNLGVIPAARLESDGGYLGWVMRLIQERTRRTEEFDELLGRVVASLESMPGSERLRWLELLSYVRAAVYHYRSGEEQPRMQETIEASVRTDEHRQETIKMGISAAQALLEKGRKEGRKEGRRKGREEGREEGRRKGREEGVVLSRRETLLKLLERRFEDVPARTRKLIDATTELAILDEWFERALSAETLADVRIGGRK